MGRFETFSAVHRQTAMQRLESSPHSLSPSAQVQKAVPVTPCSHALTDSQDNGGHLVSVHTASNPGRGSCCLQRPASLTSPAIDRGMTRKASRPASHTEILASPVTRPTRPPLFTASDTKILTGWCQLGSPCPGVSVALRQQRVALPMKRVRLEVQMPSVGHESIPLPMQ